MYYDGIDSNSVKTVALKGIESVHSCKSYYSSQDIKNDIVEWYLLFREAEFYYYSNYKSKYNATVISKDLKELKKILLNRNRHWIIIPKEFIHV